MRISAVALVAALALTSTTGLANQGQNYAQAQKPDMPMPDKAFQRWDKDNNTQLTQQEFTQGVRGSGWYNRWDRDNNNALTKQEFEQADFSGRFGKWDVNGNGILSQNELYRGFHHRYDRDEDGAWTVGEWNEAGDSGWFDT